jgi:hypothetical protein
VIPDVVFVGAVVGALCGVAVALTMDVQGRRGAWLAGLVAGIVVAVLIGWLFG